MAFLPLSLFVFLNSKLIKDFFLNCSINQPTGYAMPLIAQMNMKYKNHHHKSYDILYRHIQVEKKNVLETLGSALQKK